MPCVIDLDYIHNHPVGNYADVLRFRPVSDETKEKLIFLYDKGYSPVSALKHVKQSLEEENPEKFDQLLADRYHCPDYQFCYRLFMKEFNKQYGPATYADSLEFLNEKIVTDFNQEGKDKCIAMTQGKDYLLVAICTPLMRRAHTLLREAGELVFVDSTGNLEPRTSKVIGCFNL
ncbi:hypothetical protein R5R35_004065 [Gryllus longicercus]|uniref:Uncharacterized protein n=1 Tax=Gryllus longicercus TaxID=2509291 RepID=A0AAN9VQG7_9ORTH